VKQRSQVDASQVWSAVRLASYTCGYYMNEHTMGCGSQNLELTRRFLDQAWRQRGQTIYEAPFLHIEVNSAQVLQYARAMFPDGF